MQGPFDFMFSFGRLARFLFGPGDSGRYVPVALRASVELREDKTGRSLDAPKGIVLLINRP